MGKHLADGRVLILSYFSSALPTAFTLIDLAVFGKNPRATLAASTEEFMLSCPQCQADYKRRNTIWLAGLGATHPKLLCAKPVTKLSDLKGLKIRTSGGLGRLAEAMGAVPVGMGSTAIYAGLLRGQLDCTIGTAGWLMSHRLMRKYSANLLRWCTSTAMPLTPSGQKRNRKKCPLGQAKPGIQGLYDELPVRGKGHRNQAGRKTRRQESRKTSCKSHRECSEVGEKTRRKAMPRFSGRRFTARSTPKNSDPALSEPSYQKSFLPVSGDV